MPAITFKIENNSCISKCCSQASLDVTVCKRNSSCFSSLFRCYAKMLKKRSQKNEEEEEKEDLPPTCKSECVVEENL